MLKHLKRYWLIAAAAASCLAVGAFGYAWAQGILSLASPTGLELITVLPLQPNGQPAATQATVSINQIRNSTGYLLVATGGTVNTTVPNTADEVLATGAITTWNVTLPTAPYDGELVALGAPGGAVTTLAVTATLPAGVTIVGTAVTTLATGGAAGVEYSYSQSANVWYRVR